MDNLRNYTVSTFKGWKALEVLAYCANDNDYHRREVVLEVKKRMTNDFQERKANA